MKTWVVITFLFIVPAVSSLEMILAWLPWQPKIGKPQSFGHRVAKLSEQRHGADTVATIVGEHHGVNYTDLDW